MLGVGNKTFLHGGMFASNEVEIIEETEKAVRVKVIGDKRFIDGVGITAWFPKSALLITDISEQDDLFSLSVKNWFVHKMNRWQEIACGRA